MYWYNPSILRFNLLNQNTINIFQANNFIRGNPIESFLIFSFYIISIDIYKLGQFNLSFTFSLIFGEERHLYLFLLNALNMQLYGIQYCHCSCCMDIQVLSYLVFKDTKIDIILIASPGDSDNVTKTIYSFSWISSSPHSIDC